MKDGGFNRYHVAQAALPLLRAAVMKPHELVRFERLLERVNSAL